MASLAAASGGSAADPAARAVAAAAATVAAAATDWLAARVTRSLLPFTPRLRPPRHGGWGVQALAQRIEASRMAGGRVERILHARVPILKFQDFGSGEAQGQMAGARQAWQQEQQLEE